MITPKIHRTNLVKDHSGFKVGGYARTKAFGTRVYKVVDKKLEWQTKISYGLFPPNTVFGSRREQVLGWTLTLVKIGETNKGKFKFTNSRPFQVSEHITGHWYYPAKGI
jgi:hypothetical protein